MTLLLHSYHDHEHLCLRAHWEGKQECIARYILLFYKAISELQNCSPNFDELTHFSLQNL